jgi:predicted PurR-regulated permease PerM
MDHSHNNMKNQKLIRAAGILIVIVLASIILKYGAPFLIPLAFAAILSMLLVPVSIWLEKRGVNKAVATLLSIMILIVFLGGVVAFVSWQVKDLTKDTAKLEQQVTQKYNQLRQYISNELGIPEEKQKEFIEKQQQSSGGGMQAVTGIIGGLGSFLTNFLLVLVYIFLLIYFRAHIKRFVIRIVPDKEEGKANHAVNNIQQVSQKYLTGLSLMIIGLWIMYSIGFTLVGVKNAIFFAVLCGLLEIIPFVGNLVGNLVTIVMALSQGGDTNMVIGILITYAVIQFVQSYILEPLVVGAEVNINPLFTIVGLVAGELVWGIPGMVLAIPLLGIAKIVCDHVDSLKPFGELIGEEKKESKLKKKMVTVGKKVKKFFTKR